MVDLPVENVQDYPRPPVMQIVPDLVRVEFGGRVLVESAAAIRVLETHHAPTYYIPQEDWAPFSLRPAKGTSLCEWKGRAVYFDVVSNDRLALRAAWSFPDPNSDFAPLAGHVAVYAGPMDACWVGDNRVTPQPGQFYGGWMTPNLRGIIKGGPGTEGW